MDDRLILEVESKDEGRNAKVRLYPDRIEREKPRSRASFSRAAQDMEVTPIRSVSSVQAQKDGLSTRVTIYASGNAIVFRIHPHDAARRFADEVTKMIVGGVPPAAAPAASGGDRLSRLKDLGELRSSGVLTDAEFEVEKAKIMADEPPTPTEPAAPVAPASSGTSKTGIAGRVAAGVATGGVSEAARLLRRKKG